MSQHDYEIANQTFPSARTDLNNVLKAIRTLNAGASNPASLFSYLPFVRTDEKLLRITDAAGTGNFNMGHIEQECLGFKRGMISGGEVEWVSATQVRVRRFTAQAVTDDYIISSASNLTATITTVGVGGLQTSSSEASSTWYELYAVADSTGVLTPKLQLVPQGTAFANETGYDRHLRIPCDIYNNSGSDFEAFHTEPTQHGYWMHFRDAVNSGEFQLKTAGADTGFTAVTALASTDATAIKIIPLMTYSSASGTGYIRDGNSSSAGQPFAFADTGVSPMYGGEIEIGIDGSQQFDYKTSAAGCLFECYQTAVYFSGAIS